MCTHEAARSGPGEQTGLGLLGNIKYYVDSHEVRTVYT